MVQYASFNPKGEQKAASGGGSEASVFKPTTSRTLRNSLTFDPLCTAAAVCSAVVTAAHQARALLWI